MGDISGSAAHTITLKPVSAKAVLPILAAQGCFVPAANHQDRKKKKAASVEPVNFTGNSDQKGNTSVSKPKRSEPANEKSLSSPQETAEKPSMQWEDKILRVR